MTITLNGLPIDLTATTVACLVRDRTLPASGVAVAVNGSVVPVADWPGTALHDGDVVEVVTARQGG